jgi:hypothetical protein
MDAADAVGRRPGRGRAGSRAKPCAARIPIPPDPSPLLTWANEPTANSASSRKALEATMVEEERGGAEE